jgi:ribose transport system ATP-binding protein
VTQSIAGAADLVRRPSLEVTGLTKTFGATRALDAVDLTVRAGEVHALLGENGSGKSTFIKILSGFHAPDTGASLTVRGEPITAGSSSAAEAHGLRFVHQDLGLVSTLSVADNYALGAGFPTTWGKVRVGELHRRIREDLARLGMQIDPRTLVSALAPAQRTAVAVARALSTPAGRTPPALLVLDEPTATLPSHEVDQLLDVVRSVAATGTGVLYVTHHLEEVFRVADVATVFRDGRRVACTRVDQLTRAQLITQMVGSEFDETHALSAQVTEASTEAILDVRRLSAGLLRHLDLSVRPGELVGIAGLTGSGRESVLGLIFGASVAETGTVRVNGRELRPGDCSGAIAAGVALVPADRSTHGAVMTLSAAENLTIADLRPLWRLPQMRRRAEREEVASWFTRLDVRPANGQSRPLATFSGGNQQKVLLAKWLRRKPSVLLLDEPTQGVDIGAKAEIHRQVIAAAASGAAVLVSSADIDELVALCHRIVVLAGGVAVAELTGTDINPEAIAHASLAGTPTNL